MKKNKNIIFVGLFFLLTACAAPPSASDVPALDVTTTSLPTLTPSPSPSAPETASPTATSVPTATPTPTPAYPLGALVPLPDSPLIQPENISQAQPLLKVPERPVRFNLDFSDDGQWMMFATLDGATIYDTQTFAIKREFSNNFANFIEDYHSGYQDIRPEHVYRFVPQKGWVIVNAEMIWDIGAEKIVFRDESMKELDEDKEYFGSWRVFEIRNDESGHPLVRSFVSDVSDDGKVIVTGKGIWDMSRYRTTGGVWGDPKGGALSPSGSLYAQRFRDNQIVISSPFANLDDEAPPVSFRNPESSDNVWQQEMFFSADSEFLFVSWLKKTGFNVEVQWEVYNSQTGNWVGRLDQGALNNLIPGSHHYFLKGDNPNPYWRNDSTSCSLHVYRLWPQQKINVLKVPAEPEICQTYQYWNSHYLSHQFFGNLLVAVTHNDVGTFRMNAWNIETGEILLDQTANEPVFVLSAQKDGLFYAFYKPDSGKIEVYDSQGALVFELAYDDFSARKIIHSPDGKLRALLKEDSVTLLDIVSGSVKQVFRPESDWGRIEDAFFSKDSSSLLVAGSENFWLYSVEDGSLLKTVECRHICSLYSHLVEEGLLLIADSNSVSLYDFHSLEPLRRFTPPGKETGVAAMSPDGAFVAVSGRRNTTVFIYDTADGTVKAQLPVLKYAPNWMQFSSDGKTLYVADISIYDAPGARNMIQVWDVGDLQLPVMLREVHINRDWLADFIAPDELRGLDILLKSVSISPRQGDFVILGIRALGDTAQGWWDTHIRAFWRVNAEKPFAVAYISYSPNGMRHPLWVDASGSTEIPGQLHCGNFSPDGRFLDCGSIWWGIRP